MRWLALATAAALLALWFTRPLANSPCAETYRAFYGDEREIGMTIVFGYKDARPARFVGDRYERALLIQELTKLGFARVADDDDLLTIRMDRGRRLNLRIVNSAVGPDDRENRATPYQKVRSAEARRAFLDGLARAHAVFYNGHARVGGGPDFAPPRLTRNDHVDYAWYKRHRPGLAQLRSVLARPGGAKLVGLFACDAGTHFEDMLSRRPAIVADELIYFADSLRVTLETIRNLIAMKCQPDFSPAGTRVTRFFSSEKVN